MGHPETSFGNQFLKRSPRDGINHALQALIQRYAQVANGCFQGTKVLEYYGTCEFQ